MHWNALFSTLGLIFIAELGDKTQLAVITQTCKHRQPWAVFAGASVALTLVTLLGALGGLIIGQFIPTHIVSLVAALAFVVMGTVVGWQAYQAHKRGQDNACVLNPDMDCTPSDTWNWRAFSSTLGLLFVAELGDKTQLAVLGLAGRYHAPWAVFAGGALALILVSGLGVVGGQQLCRWIPERWLMTISSLAFVVMGVLMGLGVL